MHIVIVFFPLQIHVPMVADIPKILLSKATFAGRCDSTSRKPSSTVYTCQSFVYLDSSTHPPRFCFLDTHTAIFVNNISYQYYLTLIQLKLLKDGGETHALPLDRQ